MKESKKNLDDWYRLVLNTKEANEVPTYNDEHLDSFPHTLGALISNDMDIPEVLPLVSSSANIAQSCFARLSDKSERPLIGDYVTLKSARKSLVQDLTLLGLLQKDPEGWFKGGASSDDQAEFDAIALRRQEARAAKDWTAADAARDEATAKGIVLEDGPDGTTWRKA